MKKGICAILTVFMLFSIMTINVFAADGDRVDRDKANAAGFSAYGNPLFRAGLACVLTDDGWNYIDVNYKLVDLNKGRFTYVYPFFDGLAAVIDHEEKLGYIDITGKIVIPCQFGDCSAQGQVYAGFFNNGVATVFKGNCYRAAYWEKQHSEIYVAQIDRTGKIVKDYWNCNVNFDGLFLITDDGCMTDISASPTASTVVVNGAAISFDAYCIGGSNYFKLRDIAKALSGTSKQFDVQWDSSSQNINLVSNTVYTSVGGELSAGDGLVKIGKPGVSFLTKDGNDVEVTAYNINGNNYFRLRDIAALFDFGVTWDGAKNMISINTSTGYVKS